MDMTFIKFRENLAERVLEAQLKGYFLIVIPDRMVRIDRYLRGVTYFGSHLGRHFGRHLGFAPEAIV